MLDFCSVIFGCIAWWVPIRGMLPKHREGGYQYVIISLGACAFSVQFQVLKVILDLYSMEKSVNDNTFSYITQSLAVMIAGTLIFLVMSIYLRNKK